MKPKLLRDHVLDEEYFTDAVSNIEDAVNELDHALGQMINQIYRHDERRIDILIVKSTLQQAKYYLKDIKKKTPSNEPLE